MHPSWMNSGLPNLVKVCLINCNRQEFPPLGQLPNLKDLYVRRMSAVHIIGHEFYGNGIVRGFPSLQQLELQTVFEVAHIFPSVRHLSIRKLDIVECPRLCDILDMRHLYSLFGDQKMSWIRETTEMDAGMDWFKILPVQNIETEIGEFTTDEDIFGD
ncbi:hypothetical protein Q3G72_029586 [Acer saccharum]|nr:hypothetical protein Q3G72_029586 [Acer saccharum]